MLCELKQSQLDHEAKPGLIQLEDLKSPTKWRRWLELVSQHGAYRAQSIIGKNIRVDVV